MGLLLPLLSKQSYGNSWALTSGLGRKPQSGKTTFNRLVRRPGSAHVLREKSARVFSKDGRYMNKTLSALGGSQEASS